MGLLGLTLFALLHPVISAGQSRWSSFVIVKLVAAVVLFGAFGWWERVLTARRGQALLPPALLGQDGFRKGLGTALFF